MPFCPNCRSMLYPTGGVLECKKCGHKAGPAESKKVTTASVNRDILVLDESTIKDQEVMPKMRAVCSKCGNTEAYYRTQQTRKSDEPETTFLRCTKCDHRWRKY